MKASKMLICMVLSAGVPAASVAGGGLQSMAPSNSLIYGYEEMFNFDVEVYLATHAPHLLPYAEVISHWSGYSTISPKVLLTLIEQQSGLLTQRRSTGDSLENPFGTLSDKQGFAEQVRDVADKLATRVYMQSAREGVKEFGVSQDRSELALDFLFEDGNMAKSVPEADSKHTVDAFSAVYYRLFGQEFSPFDGDVGQGEGARQLQQDMQVKAVDGFLQFPFPLGQSWHVGGAHTNTGSGSYPLSSLDMSMGGGWGSNQYNVWVSASAAGQFKRHSSCFAEVVHADGWSTTYYHLTNIQYQTGASIDKNTRFANPANTIDQALCNGGQSTGPHQHWSLKRNGSWHHLNGVYLSGWRITALGNSYDTNCDRFYLTKNNGRGCAGYYRH